MAKRRTDDDDNDWTDDGFEDSGESEHDAADQARFSSRVAFCPECGAEIADDADICPKCFTWIDGATHSRPSRLKRSFRVIVVVLLLAAAALAYLTVFMAL